MNLSKEVGKSLRAHGCQLAVAESLTGGSVSSLITDTPGSSAYFLAGVVTYSDESKVSILGVREEILRAHGAVSERCALEMAKGVRALVGADIGAACTGIAGPSGATDAKPVGLVYIAVEDGKRSLVEEEHFEGTRLDIRRRAAERTLELILLLLEP